MFRQDVLPSPRKLVYTGGIHEGRLAERNGKAMVNFYKCEGCGHILAMMGEGDDACCSEGMVLLQPNTVDAAAEKHVPVAGIEDGRIKVRIGEVPHPMLPEHYIEWVYVRTSYGGMYANLVPGDDPEVLLNLVPDEVLEVYIYCNLHGLWKAKEPVLPLTYDTNDVACSAEFSAGCVNPSAN